MINYLFKQDQKGTPNYSRTVIYKDNVRNNSHLIEIDKDQVIKKINEELGLELNDRQIELVIKSVVSGVCRLKNWKTSL